MSWQAEEIVEKVRELFDNVGPTTMLLWVVLPIDEEMLESPHAKQFCHDAMQRELARYIDDYFANHQT